MELKDEFLDVIKEMIKEREKEGKEWSGKEYKRRAELSNADPDNHLPFEVNAATEEYIKMAKDPSTFIKALRKTTGEIELVILSNETKGTRTITFNPTQFQLITVKHAEANGLVKKFRKKIRGL